MISWEKEKIMKIALYCNTLRDIIDIENNKDTLKNIGVIVNDSEGNLREDIDIFYDLVSIWSDLNNNKNNTYKEMEKVNNKWANFVSNNDLTEMDCNNYLNRQQELKEKIKNIDIIQSSIATNLAGIKDSNKFIKLIQLIV